MEEKFVPYELALKLKKLGFNEECLGYYDCTNLHTPELIILKMSNKDFMFGCSAPLWQQAFDWFIEEKDLYADIYRTGNLFSANMEDMLMGNSLCEVCKEVSYEEARQVCLEKLIELVEFKKG